MSDTTTAAVAASKDPDALRAHTVASWIDVFNLHEDNAKQTASAAGEAKTINEGIEASFYSCFAEAFVNDGIAPHEMWCAIADNRGYPYKTVDAARGSLKHFNRGAKTKPSSTLRKVTTAAKNFYADAGTLPETWDELKEATKAPKKSKFELVADAFGKLEVAEQDAFIVEQMELMAQANPINSRFAELCRAVAEANVATDNLVKAESEAA